jgi:hypothetical protein
VFERRERDIFQTLTGLGVGIQKTHDFAVARAQDGSNFSPGISRAVNQYRIIPKRRPGAWQWTILAFYCHDLPLD